MCTLAIEDLDTSTAVPVDDVTPRLKAANLHISNHLTKAPPISTVVWLSHSQPDFLVVLTATIIRSLDQLYLK